MRITQPLMMISEFLSDVLCDTYQVEGGYISESEFDGKIALEICSAAEEDFDNDSRMECFSKALAATCADLNANNDSPELVYDEGTQTILATGPEILLEFLTRFSEIHNYGWENGVSEMVTIPEDFKLTPAFREQAEDCLNDPTLLRALDQTGGYSSRDALYIAILKIQHYQSEHAARPLYTLDDIRGALQADRLREIVEDNPQKKIPQSRQPTFWLN